MALQQPSAEMTRAGLLSPAAIQDLFLLAKNVNRVPSSFMLGK